MQIQYVYHCCLCLIFDHINSLKFLWFPWYSLKWANIAFFQLSFFQIVGAWRDFTVVTKLIKNFKSLYGFGEAVSKLETFVWILNHISRSRAWSLLILKASYLVKWPISEWPFTWWCQFIDWLKLKTRPNSLLNFGKANCLLAEF